LAQARSPQRVTILVSSSYNRASLGPIMFSGGNNAPPGYGPPGNGPPPDQEMGHGQNPSYGNQPGQPAGPGGYGGPPGGQPGYGGQPDYGYGGQPGFGAPPGAYPPTGAPGPGAVYPKMATTNPMNLIWFAAACCVMIGSAISFVELLFSLEWVDALEMAYLFLFGVLLAILDTPLLNQLQGIADARTAIGKYIAVLQRVTGKGAAYVFIGCALWSSMFANVEGGFMTFIACLIGTFVVFIGVFSLAIAILKSRNLNLVRLEFRKDQSMMKQMYDMHAKMNPASGITQEEFKKMTPYARGVSFEAPDIKLIFNALSSNPRRDVISLDDLNTWVNGSYMVFI